MRKAKIVATLGPASQSTEMIQKLIRAGVNVVRLNMSHGTHEDHKKTIANINRARDLEKRPLGILMDLQGPKIRVDKLAQELVLCEGDEWVIGPSSLQNKYPQYQERYIPTVYEKLVEDATENCQILFDDGLIEAQAIAKEGDVLKIKIIVGGILKSNKGINLPDTQVSAPSFTAKDRADLLFGLEEGIDFVALSFVRRASCIQEVKFLLHKLRKNIPLIAKIEKPEAIANIEEIAQSADAIMIARGDMAVEIGNHLVPRVQKQIINHCNDYGVPVITATQMLESMGQNPRPTRAEASDVANAIWDGTDAVMLSGETASGKYPVEAVKTMVSIIIDAEKTPRERPLLRHMDLKSQSAALQVAASLVAEKVQAKFILSVTQMGNSCKRMSRFRPRVEVLGVTNSRVTERRLCLYWGITPYYFNVREEDEAELEFKMIDYIRQQNLVEKGDKVVITTGDGKIFSRGHSNMVRIEQITDLYEGSAGKYGSNMQIANFKQARILLDPQVCASCQNCINTCPHDIFEVNAQSKLTEINLTKAPNCSVDMECVDACPTGAIEIQPKNL